MENRAQIFCHFLIFEALRKAVWNRDSKCEFTFHGTSSSGLQVQTPKNSIQLRQDDRQRIFFQISSWNSTAPGPKVKSQLAGMLTVDSKISKNGSTSITLNQQHQTTQMLKYGFFTS